jgi:hypothetical protein
MMIKKTNKFRKKIKIITAWPNIYVDVAILRGDNIVAGIEVKETHKVKDEKSGTIGLPFIEVEAKEILKNPLSLVPITDSFKLANCVKCRNVKKEFDAKLFKIARETKTKLPTRYFRHSFTVCWHCKKWIIVFAWPLERDHEIYYEDPKVYPFPRQIKYVYSKIEGRKCWVNTCSYCGYVQAPTFLYSKRHNVFWGFDCHGEDLLRDQMVLAHFWHAGEFRVYS